MRRHTFCVLTLLFGSTVLHAQLKKGNLEGIVIDSTDRPQAGVEVTLSGKQVGPRVRVTDDRGVFRFISVPPASDYTLTATDQGLASTSLKDIEVMAGDSLRVTLRFEQGSSHESITVKATPPVVDRRRTSLTYDVPRQVLQQLPTARDPWVIAEMAPSVMIDRENVGGSESGQQSVFVAKGATTNANNTWSLDGVAITDPASIGNSPIYYDFDTIEEIAITTGGADASLASAGVAVNIITRRGGNEVALDGRLYMTDERFQSSNLTEDLKREGVVATNRIVNIKDYGLEIGGPLVKDRLWGFAAYSVQDIKALNIISKRTDSLLTDYTFKLDTSFHTANNFEAMLIVGNKERWGRDSSQDFPAGFKQESIFHFGSPVFKLEDEHVFGNDLFISGKFAYANAGLKLTPMDDLSYEKLYMTDQTKNQTIQSGDRFWADRPMYQTSFSGEKFFRAGQSGAHDLRFGVDVRNVQTEHIGSTPGNLRLLTKWNAPWADINGDGAPDVVPNSSRLYLPRQFHEIGKVKSYGVFGDDTFSLGRLTLHLAARFDYQKPQVEPHQIETVNDNPAWNAVTPETRDKLRQLLPPIDIPEVRPDWSWKVFSPRIGATYDVFGDGRTVAKTSFARYGSALSTDSASLFRPLGASGELNFFWIDNEDGLIDWRELYWVNRVPGSYEMYPIFDDQGHFGDYWDFGGAAGYFWNGFDPRNPTQLSKPARMIPDTFRPPQTWEAILTLERELSPTSGVAASFTFRKYTDLEMEVPYFPESGTTLSATDYIVAGTVPESVGGQSTGDAAGRPFYLLRPDIPYTPFTYHGNRPEYSQRYLGLDIVFAKRYSDKWMLSGAATIQGQSQHFGPKGMLDGFEATNRWALDGGPYAALLGAGAGKISQHIYSRWMMNLAGIYDLPFNSNLSFTFLAREGNPVPRTMTIVNSAWPNTANRQVDIYLEKLGTTRLPTFWLMNLRFEKTIQLSERGQMHFMVDAFNLFNNSMVTRRYTASLGTYDVATGSYTPAHLSYNANEILNPRVFRVGVRFTY